MKLPIRSFLIAVSLILLAAVALQLFWSQNLNDMLTSLVTKIYDQDNAENKTENTTSEKPGSNQVDMLADLMTKTYGQHNAENKTWMTTEGEKSGRSYSICTEQEIDVRSEKHLMLAVCGANETMNSHVTAGSVDFYVLKGDRLNFTVAAQLTGIESGAFGQPGDVTVMRLGAAFYGFALSEGWSGQGITLGTTRIFVPKDNTLKEALSIRTSLDNSGTGACGDDQEMPPCDNLERKLITDETAPEHASYPIIVKQSGIYQTQNVDGEFKLSFDKSRWDYGAPKNFDLLPE